VERSKGYMCSSSLPNCVVSVYLYMFSFCLLNVLLLFLCCVTCTPLNLRRVGAVGIGLCDELITHSEESCLVYVPNCVSSRNLNSEAT